MVAVETWQRDHEKRCDDRQAALGREIRDLKKGAWGLAMALLAFLGAEVYFNLKNGHAAAAATAAIIAPR